MCLGPNNRALQAACAEVRIATKDHPAAGLVVKDVYWRWPEREVGGNAIDFLVQVLGRSFHDAMRELTGS